MMAVHSDLVLTMLTNPVNLFLLRRGVLLNGKIAKVRGRITSPKHLLKKMLDQGRIIPKEAIVKQSKIPRSHERKIKRGRMLDSLGRRGERRIVELLEIIMKMENHPTMATKPAPSPSTHPAQAPTSNYSTPPLSAKCPSSTNIHNNSVTASADS